MNEKEAIVEITVAGQQLSYAPDPVYASKGDDIKWVCDYPFSALVPGKKEFRKKFIPGVKSPDGKYKAQLRVDTQTAPDYYPYRVAVANPDRKPMLILLSASPDIIIRDGRK
jgi:hypothetical protein